jgi:hypothetical protein
MQCWEVIIHILWIDGGRNIDMKRYFGRGEVVYTREKQENEE